MGGSEPRRNLAGPPGKDNRQPTMFAREDNMLPPRGVFSLQDLPKKCVAGVCSVNSVCVLCVCVFVCCVC